MENHKHQFSGFWIPDYVLEPMEQKVISCQEFCLLSIVQSLSNSKKGCYASNAWLGERLGLGATRIQQMVSKLRKLGFLILVRFDGRRRHLTTCWSGEVCPERNFGSAPNETPTNIRNNLKVVTNKGKPARKTRLAPGGKTMFNKEWEPARPSMEDMSRASHLRETIVGQLKITRKANIKKWAKEFGILLKELNGDHKRLDDTLVWFREHAKDKGVPRVGNAKHFRKTFTWLEERMAKSPTSVEVGPKAKLIVEQLDGLAWPKGSRTQLGQAVQLSLDQHRQFVRRLQDFKTNRPVNILDRFIDKLLEGELTPSTHFVKNWFNEVYRQVHGWEDWGGNLVAMAFRPDSKRFQQMGRNWSQAYSGSDKRWELLMKELPSNES